MAFSPDRLIQALIQLSQYDKQKAEFDLQNEMLFAIGNYHRGTYYPAALEAIDLIIEIEKYSDKEAARKCDFAILSDLYYFQLELGRDDKQLHEVIENLIKEKLQPYADENIATEIK
jgi:hypothetical protein